MFFIYSLFYFVLVIKVAIYHTFFFFYFVLFIKFAIFHALFFYSSNLLFFIHCFYFVLFIRFAIFHTLFLLCFSHQISCLVYVSDSMPVLHGIVNMNTCGLGIIY